MVCHVQLLLEHGVLWFEFTFSFRNRRGRCILLCFHIRSCTGSWLLIPGDIYDFYCTDSARVWAFLCALLLVGKLHMLARPTSTKKRFCFLFLFPVLIWFVILTINCTLQFTQRARTNSIFFCWPRLRRRSQNSLVLPALITPLTQTPGIASYPEHISRFRSFVSVHSCFIIIYSCVLLISPDFSLVVIILLTISSEKWWPAFSTRSRSGAFSQIQLDLGNVRLVLRGWLFDSQRSWIETLGLCWYAVWSDHLPNRGITAFIIFYRHVSKRNLRWCVHSSQIIVSELLM